MALDTLWKIAVAIFFAGIFFAGVRQSKKDANGLGARQRRETELANFRFLVDAFEHLVREPLETKRDELRKMYLEAWDHDGRR